MRSRRRLSLANWVIDPANPLTARVIVNRVWGWLFGSGLVRTVDLFSTTGETPSHPELLDFLAARFVQEGWSIKRLVRETGLSKNTIRRALRRETRTLQAEIDLPNPDKHLLPGMYAYGRVRIERRNVRAVPLAAVVEIGKLMI